MYQYARSSNQSSFRSKFALSNDQIAHYAPSVLAQEAHESRGERYTFIPTIEVLDGLRREGFQPFEVRQTRVRDQSKREHTKHLVRLRHESSITSVEEVPEIIMLSHLPGTPVEQVPIGAQVEVIFETSPAAQAYAKGNPKLQYLDTAQNGFARFRLDLK